MANNFHLWPKIQASMQHIDKATYDKIQRHLADINDRITDDDIRNVKIGMPEEFFVYAATGKEEKGREEIKSWFPFLP